MEKKMIAALETIIDGKKNYPINEQVVWTYFYTYQKKHIDSVGMVTKNFWPFQAIMYDIKMYVLVQKEYEEGPKKEAWLKSLSSSLSIAFKWLGNELLVGSEYDAKKKHQHAFRAPNFEHQEADAPKVSAICVRAGRKAIIRARKMFFMPLTASEMAKSHVIGNDELAALANAMHFCQIMEDVGRMSQEGTIDSTKSGDAPKILQYVVKEEHTKKGLAKVTLMKALSRISLKSRKNEKFGIQLNFEAAKAEIGHNDRISYTAKGKYVIADMLDKIRIDGLDNAVPVDVAEKLFAIKQELPEDQMVICSRLAKGTHAATIRVMMNIYRNLRDTQKADICQAVKDANGNEEAMKAGMVVAKEQTRIAYNALANTVRSYFRAFAKMSNEQMIQLILGVTFKYMSKDASRPSSFAGIILAEEFFEYIMSLYSENDELALTRDDLAACDAEDGEEVEFVGGIVPGRAIFSRERNAIPDGKYTVRKSGKHAWVESSVRERIEARIAEAYDEETLALQTITIKSKEDADKILLQLSGAKEIVLVKDMVINGKTEYNVLVADGRPLTCYQTNVKKMVYENDELISVKHNGKDSYEIAQNLCKFYANKSGEIAFSHVLSFGENNKKQYAIILALKNVKKIGHTAAQKLLTTISSSPVKNWMKEQKASSTNGRLAALKAKAAASMEEETSTKVKTPQLTLMQRLMAKQKAKMSRLAKLKAAGKSIQ